MPRIFITAACIRAAVSDAITEADVVDILRRRRIRYRIQTDGGKLHIHIPTRTGSVRIYCGRDSGPVRYPFPAPVYRRDD